MTNNAPPYYTAMVRCWYWQVMDCIDELSPGAQRPVRAVIRLLTGFDEAEQRAWAEEQIRKLSGM